MYYVAVTGGIASGKSSVLKYFVNRGAHTINLDQVSRDVTKAGSKTLQHIAERFGRDVILENGTLDRQLLADKTFNSELNTKDLESIIYPAMKIELKKQIDEIMDEDINPRLLVIEVPLIEKAQDVIKDYDEIICVHASLAIREKRAIERGLSKEDFRQRVDHQLSDEERSKYCTYVLENNGSKDELYAQLDFWWEKNKQKF